MGTAEHINLPEYLFQIPKTQNYLICYIDLLGSKSNISENDEEIFENIYNAYSVAMTMNETKVFDKFVEAFEGDIAGASAALKEQGGLKVKLNKSRTRGGNSITTVSVI